MLVSSNTVNIKSQVWFSDFTRCNRCTCKLIESMFITSYLSVNFCHNFKLLSKSETPTNNIHHRHFAVYEQFILLKFTQNMTQMKDVVFTVFTIKNYYVWS